jgi:hypothetical protein
MLFWFQSEENISMEDDPIHDLYDTFIREKSMTALLKLVVALAEKTPGESSFVEERARIKQLFKGRIDELKQSGDANYSIGEKFVQEKRYELKQWLSFLRHTYAGAKASSKVTLQLLEAKNAVGRIHSLRIEQSGRSSEEMREAYKKVRGTLNDIGVHSIQLSKQGFKGTLKLSRTAYKMVERELQRIYFRSLGRYLTRHIFLLGAGFVFASYLLGFLPEMVRITNNSLVNGLFAFLGAFGIWVIDRSLISPFIDRQLAKTRSAHLEANLKDLLNAFYWAQISRVFSSSVLHEMLGASNKACKDAVNELDNPHFPISGYGIT